MKTSRTRSKRRDQTIKMNIVRQTKTQALWYIWNVFTFLRNPVSSLRRNRFWKLWVEFDENNDSLVAMLKQSIHEPATEKQKKSGKKYRKAAWIFAFFFQNLKKKLFKENKLRHITSCRMSLEFNDISCMCYNFHESIGPGTACGIVHLYFSFIDYKTSSMNCNFWSV